MEGLERARSVEGECNNARNSDLDTDSGYDEGDSRKAHDPFHGLYGVRMPYYFLAMALLTLPLYDWSRRWWISGAPLLTMSLLSGRLGRLSSSPALLAVAIAQVNITYALFNTSWLFFDFYIALSYPAALFMTLVSSVRVQRSARRLLRIVLKNFHFYEDKLAFFELPALDIDDGDVPCLLVVRGFTFTVSRMALEVHGIEVGVKLNDDLEIAIQTDRFTWRIMRGIEIGDIYASLKGPFTPKNKHHHDRFQDNANATGDLTEGNKPQTTRNLSSVQSHGNFDQHAKTLYENRLDGLHRTNTIIQARRHVRSQIEGDDRIRAAIGAYSQEDISVPNPPRLQMKSSELTAMVPAWVKTIFQSVPALLRIFLNQVSYHNPVHFQAITLTGCGKFANQIVNDQFFKYYPSENKEINKLKLEVERFLTDGKFSVVLPSIVGLASVPFLTHYDIITYVKVPRVLAFKSVQEQDTKCALEVIDVAELSGMSATFTIPSCLLPNHEYLLPDPPTEPQAKDVANIKMAILATLPGKLHEDMIRFASTMIKASQVLTLHKQATSMSKAIHSAADFTMAIGNATKEQLKKKLVEAHVDDSWFNKLLVKAFVFLREAKGDVGYQMDIPMPLEELRPSRTYVRRSSIMTMASAGHSRSSSAMSVNSTGSLSRK